MKANYRSKPLDSSEYLSEQTALSPLAPTQNQYLSAVLEQLQKFLINRWNKQQQKVKKEQLQLWWKGLEIKDQYDNGHTTICHKRSKNKCITDRDHIIYWSGYFC